MFFQRTFSLTFYLIGDIIKLSGKKSEREVKLLHDRIKLLRKKLGLTQEKFGEKIGLKKNSISQIENGVNSLTEQLLLSICREFNVNEEWLRNGTGEIFNPIPEEDEVALYVGELLQPDNPFAGLIVEIMRTYSQLDSKSQDVLKEFSSKLMDNLKKEG